MRIKGSGSNFLGFGSGGSGSRSDSFKQGRQPGQKVRGILLKWISQDMAWVEIDGHKLLAQLHSKPAVDSQLTFIIKQLHPEIILKEIFEASSAGVNALSMAGDFETARILFENKLRPHTSKFVTIPQDKREYVFIERLSGSHKLLTTFLDTISCLKSINHTFAQEKSIILFYAPWLVPAGRRHVGIKRFKGDRSSKLTETILEFDLVEFGMVRVEFLFLPPNTSYRLKLQRTAKGMELNKYLTTRQYADLPVNIQCLGVTPLPQREHGGILTEFLFKK